MADKSSNVKDLDLVTTWALEALSRHTSLPYLVHITARCIVENQIKPLGVLEPRDHPHDANMGQLGLDFHFAPKVDQLLAASNIQRTLEESWPVSGRGQ